jgi:Transposase DNA-binding
MMPAARLLSPLLWAEATFGAVQLGDRRRNRRAVAIAQALATETGASLPKQLHDGAALEATYRFLHSGQVSYEDLIRPHVEATRQDCREQQEVLLIQDTTEVDYQQHPKTRGLPTGCATRL